MIENHLHFELLSGFFFEKIVTSACLEEVDDEMVLIRVRVAANNDAGDMLP
jgi:hypothetical protein